MNEQIKRALYCINALASRSLSDRKTGNEAQEIAALSCRAIELLDASGKLEAAIDGERK
jgi:hypothetical protein